MSKRTEGWGNLDNSAKAHYFMGRESLCRKWLAWGSPRWESNQAKGEVPDNGTCRACWKKAPALAPVPADEVEP